MDHWILVCDSLLEFVLIDVDVIENCTEEAFAACDDLFCMGNSIIGYLLLKSFNCLARDREANVAQHQDDTWTCSIDLEEKAKNKGQDVCGLVMDKDEHRYCRQHGLQVWVSELTVLATMKADIQWQDFGGILQASQVLSMSSLAHRQAGLDHHPSHHLPGLHPCCSFQLSAVNICSVAKWTQGGVTMWTVCTVGRSRIFAQASISPGHLWLWVTWVLSSIWDVQWVYCFRLQPSRMRMGLQ